MSIEHLIHPLNVQVINDPTFFHKPQPHISCLHCYQPCNRGPPVPLPTDSDIHTGQAHPRDAAHFTYTVTNVRKLYCDIHCAKAASTDQNLWWVMCTRLYGVENPLLVRTALPSWTLEQFGGLLSIDQFNEWKLNGTITGVVPPKTMERDSDISESERLVGEWMDMKTWQQTQNRFFQYRFRDDDSFFRTPQPGNTKLACWNCTHSLAHIEPRPAVLDYDEDLDDAKTCQGFFCGPACRLSYIIRLSGQLLKIRISWNQVFYSLYFYGGMPLEENRSPCRRLLAKFGGPLTINQFRIDTVLLNNPYILVREPPIRTFPVLASLNTQGMYVLNYQTHSWHVLNLMRKGNKGKDQPQNYDGDEFGLGTTMFPAVYHTTPAGGEGNKLHFVLLTIEQKQVMQSNDDVLQEMLVR